MSWQKVWRGKRKKALPNRLKTNPTISFRSDLSPEALSHVKMLALQKEKSGFINKAIEMRYYFLTNKEKFISEMIKDHFQLARHILRKVGSSRNAVTG